MHYLVDMWANSLEALVFCLVVVSFCSQGTDNKLKCYLKTQNLELQCLCNWSRWKNFSQIFNTKIQREGCASLWLRILGGGGGKIDNLLPSRSGEPLKTLQLMCCSWIFPPVSKTGSEKQKFIRRWERGLPAFISPTPKFSKEKNLQ